MCHPNQFFMGSKSTHGYSGSPVMQQDSPGQTGHRGMERTGGVSKNTILYSHPIHSSTYSTEICDE